MQQKIIIDGPTGKSEPNANLIRLIRLIADAPGEIEADTRDNGKDKISQATGCKDDHYCLRCGLVFVF